MDFQDWLPELRWSESLFLRYGVLSLVLSVGLGILTAVVNPVVAIGNIRTLFTTLAIIEASILAIVFSVTVVALQLVVNRYSARLSSLFVGEPLFRVTFGLFIVAIMINLVATYLLPRQVTQGFNGLVGVAFGLAAVSIYALYQFIQMMIQRGSPDELITVLIERELKPENYLPETRGEFADLEIHPIRPLYQTISRAIELGEFQTGRQGITGIRTVLIGTIEYLVDKYSLEEAAEYAESVAEEVLTEYIPSIIEQIYNHEQYDLLSTVISDVEAVAASALEDGVTEVTIDAADGLQDAAIDAPMTVEGNRLREPIKESLLTMATDAAREADYSTFVSVFHSLNFPMQILIRRRPDANIIDYFIDRYFSHDFPGVFETLLGRYEQDIAENDINWLSPTDGKNWTLPEEAEPLRYMWKTYVKLSKSVLRYRLSEGEYPFSVASFRNGWRKMAQYAADSNIDGLATLFVISMIQITYHLDQLGDGGYGLWVTELGRIRREYDAKFVDRAFESLENGKRPEGHNISIQIKESEPVDKNSGVIDRFIQNEDNNPQFIEWLKDFEQDVLERTEELREKE